MLHSTLALDSHVVFLSGPDPVRVAASLGRTIARWRHEITAWHRARFSNGPTEAVNNLVKRIKGRLRITNFRDYRIRALLYAGKLNWDLLATDTPCANASAGMS